MIVVESPPTMVEIVGATITPGHITCPNGEFFITVVLGEKDKVGFTPWKTILIECARKD